MVTFLPRYANSAMTRVVARTGRVNKSPAVCDGSVRRFAVTSTKVRLTDGRAYAKDSHPDSVRPAGLDCGAGRQSPERGAGKKEPHVRDDSLRRPGRAHQGLAGPRRGSRFLGPVLPALQARVS